MITFRGEGEVHTHLYLIGNPGTSRLFELHIGAVTMFEGTTNNNQVKYYGKIIGDGQQNENWIELEATIKADALEELKNIVDTKFRDN